MAFKAGRSLYLFYVPHAIVFIHQKYHPVIRKNSLLCVGAFAVEQERENNCMKANMFPSDMSILIVIVMLRVQESCQASLSD